MLIDSPPNGKLEMKKAKLWFIGWWREGLRKLQRLKSPFVSLLSLDDFETYEAAG